MKRLLAAALAVLAIAAPVMAQQAPITAPRIKQVPADKSNPMSPSGEPLTGDVLVTMCVDVFGKVTRVEVQRSSGVPQLDAAAVADSQGIVYEPATQVGQPVPFCGKELLVKYGAPKTPEQHGSRVSPLRLALLGALEPGTAFAVMAAAGAGR